MNTVAQFDVTHAQSIKILMPEFEKKENLYCVPISELHRYDVIQVVFQRDAETVVLYKSVLGETINRLSSRLAQLLRQELNLLPSCKQRKMSLAYSKTMYYEGYQEEVVNVFMRYWIWSVQKGLQTWGYTIGKKMYLEISPLYPWLFGHPKPEEAVIPFEEYVKSYQPFAMLEISREQAQEWLEKCQEIEKILQETLKKTPIRPDVFN